jgi:hypothetical protein
MGSLWGWGNPPNDALETLGVVLSSASDVPVVVLGGATRPGGGVARFQKWVTEQ